MKSRFFVYIFILILPHVLFSSSDYRIITSTDNYVVIEYTPIYEISVPDTNNNVKKQVFVHKTYNNSENPVGQYREFLFGTPSGEGNTISLLSYEKKVIQGDLITPEVNPDETNDYPEDEIVLPGNSGRMRSLNVASALVYPVKYNSDASEITIYTKVILRVNFGQGTGSYKNLDSDKDHKLYSLSILNYDQAKKWGISRQNKITKTNSVSELASGKWYRFETESEGIYKISRDDLSSLGIDAGTVNPANIKIYSGGGLQLSETLGDYKSFAEKEVPLFIEGGDDGSFDQNDYILLYGRNVDFWQIENNSQIVRNTHSYSQKNYFYITVSETPGKRMSLLPSVGGSNFVSQSTTRTFKSFEENNRNLHKTGRLFVGDEFSQSNNNHTYITSLSNRVSTEPITYNFSFVNNSVYSRNLNIEENGRVVYSHYALGNTNTYGLGRVNKGTFTFDGSLPDNRSALKFTFQTNSPEISGYLDYFEIEYISNLIAEDEMKVFYSNPVNNNIRYEISGFANTDINIFQVSDFYGVKKVSGAMLSGGEAEFIIAESADNINKYISVCASNYKSISGISEIKNTRIPGAESNADYLIIAPELFENPAEKLAGYRTNEAAYPLKTEIVFVEDIMKEYSIGASDPTAIRNFLYEVYNNWSHVPRYILFFGDGDYDYFDTEGYNKNLVPTYQTVESLDDVNSYMTDDYYVRLNENSDFICFAHGRIPASDENDAINFIDKLINYETNLEKGPWRSKITMVADDMVTTSSSSEIDHTANSENISRYDVPDYFYQEKIYLGAYPTVNTGLGKRKPSVNQAIVDAINNGTVLLNFIGHGNPNTWTHEYVFEKASTIPLLHNEKLFFLTAATCDFGRFDDPASTGAMEDMLFMNNKGMIGTLSATRAVYSSLNYTMASNFYEALLMSENESGIPVRVGDAYFSAKTVSSAGTNVNSQKYVLFSDPAMILDIPELPGQITKINGNEIDEDVQLKALQSATVEGEVYEVGSFGSAMLPANFNGEAIVTVYDSDREVRIQDLNYYRVTYPGGVIFKGRVSVENGKFNSGFTVPKDISYENKNGKIIVYFYNESKDGIVYSDNIIIGGTDSTVTNDGRGPEISIYFDELNEEGSYLVNSDFQLLVKLEDETGLNTTGSGVGHKLEGVIDNSTENSLDLTNYFIGDLNTAGKSGVIEYNVSSMEPGDHSIKVNAWDVFNNFSSEETYFTVVNAGGLVLRDVVNYPNPFSSQTYFTFQHNYTSPVDVSIKVYTIAGRLIREIEESSIMDKFVKVFWDGRDADGDIIANGTYLYKLVVETTDGQARENFLGKMAVIR